MLEKFKRYIALIDLRGVDKDYFTLFIPDFDDAMVMSKSYDDVIMKGNEKVSLLARERIAYGKKLPKPSELHEIKENSPMYKKLSKEYMTIAYVNVKPGNYKRPYLINMDTKIMNEVDKITTNRSAFIANAVRHELDNIR